MRDGDNIRNGKKHAIDDALAMKVGVMKEDNGSFFSRVIIYPIDSQMYRFRLKVLEGPLTKSRSTAGSSRTTANRISRIHGSTACHLKGALSPSRHDRRRV